MLLRVIAYFIGGFLWGRRNREQRASDASVRAEQDRQASFRAQYDRRQENGHE